MYIYCSTVHSSKDLEPTQMPINDRLDSENVAHIQHGILCSHKKRRVHVLFRDMDEPRKYHSQKTDTRTENRTPHVLTHRRMLSNENTWTPGGEHHPLGSLAGRDGGGIAEDGGWGGIILGEISNIGDRGMNAANHHGMCIPM